MYILVYNYLIIVLKANLQKFKNYYSNLKPTFNKCKNLMASLMNKKIFYRIYLYKEDKEKI